MFEPGKGILVGVLEVPCRTDLRLVEVVEAYLQQPGCSLNILEAGGSI
jgi:hypothetical protein